MADLVNAFIGRPGQGRLERRLGGRLRPHPDRADRALGRRRPSKINYIASKGGGDQVANIVGGHVTAGVAGLGEFAEHIKGGRMRALAVSAPGKLDGIASLKEQGIDVVLGNWRGVRAPGISTAQRDALIGAVKTATESAAWKETLAKMGWESVVPLRRRVQEVVEDDTRRIRGISSPRLAK